jgi:ABC-type nitrate/sulfonate/bicarbonate transport system substrate-binding protein
MLTSVRSDTHSPKSEGAAFWLLWHVASLVVVLSAPAFYRWGRGNVMTAWVPEIIAMAAVYLCLATLIALLRPQRTAASVVSLALAGVGLFASAYVLLDIVANVPVSRVFVALSAALATSLALMPIVLGRWRTLGFLVPGAIVTSLFVLWNPAESGRPHVQVVLGTRSLSKLPFVIALDQGLYEKYGLDVELWMPPPEFPGGIAMPANGHDRPRRPDILVDGQSPIIYRMVTDARFDDRIALAGGDCVVRTQIVGSKELKRLADLKGKRLGVNHQVATTGFVARLLARRMGWDPVLDLSILDNGRDAEALRQGLVDAVVANERQFARLAEEGYPVLANTLDWNEPIAGNSVLVQPAWLKAAGHRDIALRFLKASAEGIALFHEQPEVALAVMAKWNGVTDRKMAETIYGRGDSMPRKPYPCRDGIRKTMELFDSNEMRRYRPEDFYDDSLLRELEQSGFLDSLYR